MKIFVTPIGSGNTLNFPHQKNYEGILAIAENTIETGLVYSRNEENVSISQEEMFNLKMKNTKYHYLKILRIESSNSIYEIGKLILIELNKVKQKHKNIKFHLEVSAGYKRIGHILTLIAYINEEVERLTFLAHNDNLEILPIIKVNLHKREREILEGFSKGTYPGWNRKINTNKYVLKYKNDKKYVYRVLKKCKNVGLITQNNQITDFGKLYLNFS